MAEGTAGDEWTEAEAYSSYGPAVEDTYEYDEYAGAEKCQLLSMLAADGLDMDYEEPMDYAADVIQADMETERSTRTSRASKVARTRARARSILMDSCL